MLGWFVLILKMQKGKHHNRGKTHLGFKAVLSYGKPERIQLINVFYLPFRTW